MLQYTDSRHNKSSITIILDSNRLKIWKNNFRTCCKTRYFIQLLCFCALSIVLFSLLIGPSWAGFYPKAETESSLQKRHFLNKKEWWLISRNTTVLILSQTFRSYIDHNLKFCPKLQTDSCHIMVSVMSIIFVHHYSKLLLVI